MKRNKFLLPLALLLVFVLLLPLYGCGGGGQEENGSDAQEAVADAEIGIDELFAKASDIDGYSFDYVLTASDQTIEGKMALKGSKMRVEMDSPEGQMIQIIDQEVNKAWTYIPEQDMALELDLNQVDVPNTPSDFTENAEDMATNADYLGKEEVNGFNCHKYSVEDEEDSIIYWVHSKYGLPVRVEITTEDEVTTMDYKNFEFGDIKDSLFQLPDGVEVQRMSDMMQNLPAAP